MRLLTAGQHETLHTYAYASIEKETSVHGSHVPPGMYVTPQVVNPSAGFTAHVPFPKGVP